jgi:hypothetical protein
MTRIHRYTVGAALAAAIIAAMPAAQGQGHSPPADAKAPEIAVLQGNTPIADGGIDPMGNVAIGTVSRAYTIKNDGTAKLKIVGGVNDPLNLVNVSNFKMTNAPAPTVSPGDFTSYSVQFDVDLDGPFSLDLVILNSDSDETPYTITTSGTGTGGEPEMGLSFFGSAIADGGTDEVGPVASGILDRTYTITNSGTGDLAVDTVSASEFDNVSNFKVKSQPATQLAPGASGDLTIQFMIDRAEAFSFNVEIANSDSDENPYDVAVKGTGASATASTGESLTTPAVSP